MIRRLPVIALLSALFFQAFSLQAAPLVAPTEPLSPQEQLKKFKLPPGFEIQLVASEPTIGQPMNMNFDSRGRLWVTSSNEYPWPAADPAKARDRLTVFTNIGADGRPEKSHVFADKLNIPIGVVPLKGGKEAIVWSIPNIWKMTDTNDDGLADQREILFGPFDYVDTHGNQNAFRHHLDGWIYANHGFRNNSNQIKAKGQGPVVMRMQSGNTYRFKPDGSKIELWSAGQVNPFGLTFDEWGNLFSADCHSKACTMVIRGAHYESFGKPHDGLGFGPNMTNDSHGSSGIGGIAYYSADHFPKEYRNCLYLGNVVTGIVHRDVIKWNGSTPWVDKPVDFITCDDPWFRPVDIQLGPDGALYIADFYNCIIGHYEVDLKHPRRDRDRGRIWRVVYKGVDGKADAPKVMVDLTKCKEADFVDALNSSNLTKRSLAVNALIDESHEWLRGSDLNKTQLDRPSLYVIAERLPNMRIEFDPRIQPDDDGTPPLTKAMIEANVAHVFAERPNVEAGQLETMWRLLRSDTAMVVRFAADALGRHPNPQNIKPLLAAWDKAREHDTALIHTIRLALRNQLRSKAAIEQLSKIKLEPAELSRLIPIALAVPNESAAWFAFDYALHHDTDPALTARIVAHVAKHIGDGRLGDVIRFIRSKYDSDIDRQLALFQSIHAGMKQRGTQIAPDSDMKKWAFALASDLLDTGKHPPMMWTAHKPGSDGPTQAVFGLRERTCDDGQKMLFIDSIVHGEKRTGIFRSHAFEIPASLSFHLCGHNGLPGTKSPQTNFIRLQLVEGDAQIAIAYPPRSDTARKVTWDLSKWAGKQGHIEIIDGDSRESYAWIGAARFEPAVVRVPASIGDTGDRTAAAIVIAGELQLTGLTPTIQKLLTDGRAAASSRLAAAGALMQLDRDGAVAALSTIVKSPEQFADLRARAARLIAPVNTAATREAMTLALTNAPGSLQSAIALSLCATGDGCIALLDAVAAGKASPRLLQEKAIAERLKAGGPSNVNERIAELTKNLPSVEERLGALIAERATKYLTADASPVRGLAVFKKNCAACHKIEGTSEGDIGNLVGPQLTGIGVRGHERLLEDILDPNRNVDGAFKSFIYTLKDGEVITGMKLREEGRLLVLADAQGKEIRLSADDIAESRPSTLSPMPANLADTIGEADLFDLLALLLSLKSEKAVP